MAFYSEKIGVWNGYQMMWDSFQTSALMHKSLTFIFSGTLACAHRFRACMHIRMYAYACPKVSVAFIFQK